MDVLILPARADNYVYVAHNGHEAFVVDPCGDGIVDVALRDRSLVLTHILVTHHHADHTDGIPALCAQHNCEVVGPADPRIPSVTQAVSDGSTFTSAGTVFKTLAVPGHTRTHVAFHAAAERLLFTGDALFVAGCGRIFEGDPAQMWASLKTLRALPDDTAVYCGHDYTRDNLEFAAHLEADNTAIRDALCALDRTGLTAATVPSSIGREKCTNPFFRCDDPDFSKHVLPQAGDAVARFAALRSMKDHW